MAKSKKIDYVYAKGKRRTSSARLRLYKGTGEITVNDKPIEEYFSDSISKLLWMRPFQITDSKGKYYFSAKVKGGGRKGQIEAIVHALSVALTKESTDFRPKLKKMGLLTRDARIRERRKVGMGGKSRRKKQSPKR